MTSLKYFFITSDLKTCILQKAANTQKNWLYLNTSVTQSLKINLMSSPLVLWVFYRNKSKAVLDFLSSPSLFLFYYGLKD